MPGPGFPVANKILYKYEQDRAYRLHRQKVRVRVGMGYWEEVIGFKYHLLTLCYVGKICNLLKTEKMLLMYKKSFYSGFE